MRIGEVSNVVHGILIDGWNWYVHKETGPLKDAKLTIEKIDAITHCDSCGKDYETIKYGKKCPHCGSENTYLLQGNEVEIKEIKIY